MYPEFERAMEYFRDTVYSDPNNKRVLPDVLLKKYADETIKKFGLKESYYFSRKPNTEQLARLNTSMILKQIKARFIPKLYLTYYTIIFNIQTVY